MVVQKENNEMTFWLSFVAINHFFRDFFFLNDSNFMRSQLQMVLKNWFAEISWNWFFFGKCLNVFEGVWKCLKPTNQLINSLIEAEMSYINTNHSVDPPKSLPKKEEVSFSFSSSSSTLLFCCCCLEGGGGGEEETGLLMSERIWREIKSEWLVLM